MGNNRAVKRTDERVAQLSMMIEDERQQQITRRYVLNLFVIVAVVTGQLGWLTLPLVATERVLFCTMIRMHSVSATDCV